MSHSLKSSLQSNGIAPVRPGHDTAVDGLRACAALMVLYTHLTSPAVDAQNSLGMLDPHYTPSGSFWHVEAGVQAVLLFFILSGYVIGLTNTQPPSWRGITGYIHRRAVRLLPIYFIAVILGWWVIPAVSWRNVAGNLLFLQNAAPGNPFSVGLLPGNGNLWSLHYEAFYYITFIAIWLWRPRLLFLYFGLFAMALLGVFAPDFSLWMSWLACGFIFWIAGLAIAWRLPQISNEERQPWPSAILLCIATWKLAPLGALLNRCGLFITWLPGVTLNYLDSLPPLLWLFLMVTRRQAPWKWALEIFAWTWSASYIAWRLIFGTLSWHDSAIPPIALLVLAALLRIWKPTLSPLRRLAPIGAISYGAYALGAPLQFLGRSVFPDFSGSFGTWATRAIITLTVTLVCAWVLEGYLQPRLRKYFS